MTCKKAIKNAVIFTAMLLIVGINSTPLISKASNSFGVAFLIYPVKHIMSFVDIKIVFISM